MAQQFEPVFTVSRHDLDRCILVYRAREVPKVTIDANGDRIASEASRNISGNEGSGYGVFIASIGSVG